jgi:hypothetical protein
MSGLWVGQMHMLRHQQGSIYWEIAPCPGGNISQCHLRYKYEKEKRNWENVKEKGRKGKENKKMEKRG